MEQAVSNLDGKTRFSVIYNNNGSFDRVKINDDIFENNNGKSISKTIYDYIEKHIGDVYTNIESGQKVYLGKDLPSEYAYSESSKFLPIQKKLAKGRATTNFKEIIENASNRRWQKNTKSKHELDAKYGFYKYDTTFSFDYNDRENIYTATILIRNDANGKKYLYDIDEGIKKQRIKGKWVSFPNINNSLSANNIPQSNNKVKSDISTKYSMQESPNNTQNISEQDLLKI